MSASTDRQACRVEYAAAPLGAPTAEWSSPAFSAADTVTLSNWEWRQSGPESDHPDFAHPAVRARCVWDQAYLAVMFEVDDHYVQCKGTAFQDMVCLDSCCEFFIAPEATSKIDSPYFNFEVSANGTMLVYHCTPDADGNNNTTPVSDEWWAGDGIKMAASLVDTVGTPVEPEVSVKLTWRIEYHLPWALFAAYFPGCGAPSAGDGWSANFYKCADQTSHPHWGAWSSTYDHPSGRPAFHHPDWFGAVTFVGGGLLPAVGHMAYTIVLCDDLPAMQTFYAAVFGRVPGVAAAVGLTGTSPPLRAGLTLLSLRERTRPNDGVGGANPKPGVQLAFLVEDSAEVLRCHAALLKLEPAVAVTEPPADQPRGHRTVYFEDPEGNQLEIFAEVPAFDGPARPLAAAHM
jgi:catechol 2,3-dioxygenase-like lactoylglutathione lyase family enzyme